MRPSKYSIILLLLIALPASCQTAAKAPAAAVDPAPSDTSLPGEDESALRADEPAQLNNGVTDEMEIPAPVSTAGYSMEFAAETPRSNYLSGGLNFTTAYDDDIRRTSTGRPIGDVGYSVYPTFSWSQATSRTLWDFAYAPGFTFYQHDSHLDQFNQSVALDSQFRLSPHVTLRLRDGFVKSSNPFDQLTPGVNSSTEHAQPVATIVSPVTDQITNSGSAQLTYQFGPNSMVGATGLFSELRYLNPAQVPGLFNSNSKGAEAFYSRRFSGRHYIGTSYQYQALVSTPNHAQSETQRLVLFYTIYLQPKTSLSVFAGPQHSNSHGGGFLPMSGWSPSYGGSFGWAAANTSFTLGVEESISGGGGLQGAVRAETARAAIRRQLTKALSLEAGTYYSDNVLLTPQTAFSNGGHTLAGTVSVQRQVRGDLAIGLSYTRLHQSYPNLGTLSAVPNTNRVCLSLSYHFTRPIGR